MSSNPQLFQPAPWDGNGYAMLATLSELGLPPRVLSCARQRGIRLVGELVQVSEVEMLRWPSMGRKSVRATKEILSRQRLQLGMKLTNWDKSRALEERQRQGRSLLRMLAERDGTTSPKFDCLEDELQGLIAAIETGRNIPLLMSLLGFDGTEPKTLEAVGQEYGLTRERVRQLSERARKTLALRWHQTPRLNAALSCVAQIAPASSEAIREELISRGIARGKFSPDAVLEAAELTGHGRTIARFVIADQALYGTQSHQAVLRRCVHNLRKSTSSNGCTSVERLAVEANLPMSDGAKIRRVLDTLPEAVWLDHSRTWVFSNRPTRNRIVNYACKVFAATDAVDAGELRRALSRSHRIAFVPPAEALANLLENKGVAKRVGHLMVRAPGGTGYKLGSIEEVFLSAFQTLGSPVSREALEEYCIDEKGMHPTSFYIYLSYSPIVLKLMPGVYALVGAEVQAGVAEEVRAGQLAARAATEHGWTTDGRLWLVFPIDRLFITSASRAMPTYVGDLTLGTWSCVLAGGLEAGQITVENGFVGGLRGAFTLLAPDPGDFLRLDFNLRDRVVQAIVGGLELKELDQVEMAGQLIDDDEAEPNEEFGVLDPE